jgi:hypothetical protein
MKKLLFALLMAAMPAYAFDGMVTKCHDGDMR